MILMTKKDPKAIVTNETLGKTLNEATDAILKGMDELFKKSWAKTGIVEKTVIETKEELKTEIGWLKDDVNGLKADPSDIPSKKEFNQLKVRVDKYLSG